MSGSGIRFEKHALPAEYDITESDTKYENDHVIACLTLWKEPITPVAACALKAHVGGSTCDVIVAARSMDEGVILLSNALAQSRFSIGSKPSLPIMALCGDKLALMIQWVIAGQAHHDVWNPLAKVSGVDTKRDVGAAREVVYDADVVTKTIMQMKFVNDLKNVLLAHEWVKKTNPEPKLVNPSALLVRGSGGKEEMQSFGLTIEMGIDKDRVSAVPKSVVATSKIPIKDTAVSKNPLARSAGVRRMIPASRSRT